MGDRIFENYLDSNTQLTNDVLYYYINNGGSIWLEHVIADKNDYDQIIQVTISPPLKIPPGSQNVIVKFENATNKVEKRPYKGQEYKAVSLEQVVTVSIVLEISCLVGPDFTKQAPPPDDRKYGKEGRKEGKKEGSKEGKKEVGKEGKKEGSKEGKKEGSGRKEGRKDGKMEGSGRKEGRKRTKGRKEVEGRKEGTGRGKETREKKI